MNIQCFICILLFYFLTFAFSEDLKATKFNPNDLNLSKPWKEKVKREISLEVFSDIKESKKNNSDFENDVINVCGTGLDCVCDENVLACWDQRLNTTNLQPNIDNFVVQKVEMCLCKNLTIEKGKVFSRNEGTIKSLEFINVEITKIDSSVFDDLTSLETLIFGRSTFPFFDENVLTKNIGKTLTTLTLHGCEIQEINLSSFKNLVNLQKLDLHFNLQLNGKLNGKFPKSLSKLKILNLEFCNLTFLADDTFENLKSLEELNMPYNRFTSIPSAIKVLTNIKTFDFSRNKLKKLKQNDFSSNINLEILYFVHNFELEMVENCAFCSLKNLRKIYFSENNKLSYINENAFGAVSIGYSPKLEAFNIVNCNISVLHENLLDWKNVGELYLNGNPFACNCSMAWLFNDLMSDNSIYEKKLSHWYVKEHHHKFYLGCLGPPPTTPNHTFPYTIVEIFSSFLIVGLVYANRSRRENVLSKWF
uniref:Uncharacterized protein n=1 Tax=Panagrolaimus sp. PS1159 TaxID=55785 RepID=A0AC35FV31_9BILA